MKESSVEKHAGNDGEGDGKGVLGGEFHPMEEFIGDGSVHEGQGLGSCHQEGSSMVENQKLQLGAYHWTYYKKDQDVGYD